MPISQAAVTRHADLSRQVAQLTGKRAALVDRLGVIRPQMEAAQARLECRPQIEAALLQLQREEHERAAGVFSKLLTAIVADVLADPALGVNLELATSRGAPDLKIFAERTLGDMVYRENIAKACGGSLRNIVSVGLRFAALVRSGARRFIALDEPDHWIKPAFIPAFVEVLAQMAREVGVQILMISHHAPWFFERDARIIELDKDLEGKIVASGRDYLWGIDEPGFRYIRATNFGPHEDTLIPLGPGLNVVTGDNNLGKSWLLTGLSALQGDGDDECIRHGCSEALFEIGCEQGVSAQWKRRRTGSPKQIWNLYSGVDDQPINSAGGEQPDWFKTKVGLHPIEGFDIQIARQDQSVFLIGSDTKGRERAQVLAVGRDAGHAQDAVLRYREHREADTTLVKTFAREIPKLDEAIGKLDGLPEIDTTLVQASDLAREIREGEQRAAALEGLIAQWEQAEQRAAQGRRELAVLETVPKDAPKLADTLGLLTVAAGWHRAMLTRSRAAKVIEMLGTLPEAPGLADTKGLLDAAVLLQSATRRREQAEAVVALLQDVPTAPVLAEPAALAGLIAGAEAAAAICTSAAAEVVEVDRELDSLKGEIENMLAESGHTCPLCRQAVNADILLGTTTAAADAAHHHHH